MAEKLLFRYVCIAIASCIFLAACAQSTLPARLIPPTTTTQAILEPDKSAELASPTATSEPTPTVAPTATTLKEAQLESALVVQVLDGDTIEVMMASEKRRLRYIGIDSPEDGQPFSAEATEANRRLVEGKKVLLEKDVSETDRYDRLLRYVYLLDGTFVNAELVRSGLARAVTYEPDTQYQPFFLEMEAEAQAGQRGIWGQPAATATIPAAGGAVIIDPACSQFNAPGNDNDNKIEEYVCLANQSAATVDLSGWTIRDEYGWRYTFPVITLESGASLRVRTGCGTDTVQDLHWCRDETAIWNNDADCGYLLDSQGEIVHQYCY